MGFNGFPDPLGPSKTRADPFSVAHVRPRTYTGITDLLLLNLAWLNATSPSKKLYTGAAADARAIYQARLLLDFVRETVLHQLATAMHHHLPNQERALNLSILTVSGPGEVPRVESN
ncbi:hypothetical protein DPMN_152443 [Dreissena polymorpha]|uniref:Uncharacterized protein n=1 Tax=Dreissena polymorpha TaxID=45954 RepID=A0A9D4FLU3_DREPO|nr:hypothetical protein DPMN_152443 [Dreissena polymorpha]